MPPTFPSLTTIILTYNEEIHIERCIKSVSAISERVIVIDSYSTDRTIELVKLLGGEYFQHTFVNQAQQFQWALDTIPLNTDWVMRIDADEYLTEACQGEIKQNLYAYKPEITGIYIKRQVHFMSRWIRFGGYYPIKLLRIWRNGIGSIEQRWMDEHVKLAHGKTIELNHDLIDDNLNNLSWWTDKHNNYATREAVDVLNQKYNFFNTGDNLSTGPQSQASRKRWYKDNLYNRLPLFFRSSGYFIWRYIFQLGFLDGYPGLIWHFLQAFWYRFLIDAKIFQIEHLAKKKKKTVQEILIEDFNFKL